MAVLKIYQLKDSPENRFRRWLDYNSLGKLGETPQLRNYDKVYSRKLLDSPTPEQVVRQFSQSRPADFTGHSLSTSDIIAFQGETETIVYYVDNVGYTRLPDLEKELAAAAKAPRICLEIYQMRGDLQKHVLHTLFSNTNCNTKRLTSLEKCCKMGITEFRLTIWSWRSYELYL